MDKKETEKLKASIEGEYRETLLEINSDIEDVKSIIDLYFKILKYDNIVYQFDDLSELGENRLNFLSTFFLEDDVAQNVVNGIVGGFEKFTKKLYYVLSLDDKIVTEKFKIDLSKQNTFTKFLEVLNKIRPVYKDKHGDDVMEKEQSFSQKPITNEQGNIKFQKHHNIKSFDKYKNIDSYSREKSLSTNDKNNLLVNAYILRNIASHQDPINTKSDKLRFIKHTIVSELLIVCFLKRELKNALVKDSINSDIVEFIETESNKYINSRYVPMNISEIVNDNNDTQINGLIENILTNNNNRFMLYGDGGAGKTTSLKYLSYHYSKIYLESDNKQEELIPIFIASSNMPNHLSVLDCIANKINCSLENLEERLTKKTKFLLIFDAINELDDETKQEKEKGIENLLTNYDNVSAIISDRFDPDTLSKNKFSIKSFAINELNQDQINDFIYKYCNKNERFYQVIKKEIDERKSIHKLIIQPIFLGIVIDVLISKKELPDSTNDLIEEFIEVLLEREKTDKKDNKINIRDYKYVLAFVANKIHTNFGTNKAIDYINFITLINDAKKHFSLEKIVAGHVIRICQELRILQLDGDDINFYHQMYFEFFNSMFFDIKRKIESFVV